jgi:hypothetical protein
MGMILVPVVLHDVPADTQAASVGPRAKNIHTFLLLRTRRFDEKFRQIDTGPPLAYAANGRISSQIGPYGKGGEGIDLWSRASLLSSASKILDYQDSDSEMAQPTCCTF